MREIKFRAWDGNKMRHKGFSIDSHGAAYWTGDYLMEIWPFEEESIMQYTGLKDNNGKEIYEGDVLRGEYGGVYVVKFGSYEQEHEGWTRDCGGWTEEGTGWYLVSEREWFEMTLVKDDGWEVIGNIYELPVQGVEDV